MECMIHVCEVVIELRENVIFWEEPFHAVHSLVSEIADLLRYNKLISKT